MRVQFGTFINRQIFWIVISFAVSIALSDPRASAGTSAGPVQDGAKGTVVRQPKRVAVDPSMGEGAAAAARTLVNSLTARSTVMSVYENLLGAQVKVAEGSTALPVLLRYDRESWNPAASTLAGQLATLGKEEKPATIAWLSWGAASKDGAKAVSAFRAQLRGMAGPGLVADAIAARKDPLGIWVHLTMYGPAPAVGIVGGQPFVTSTISAFATSSMLSGAGVLDRELQLDGPTAMVAVLVDVEQGKGVLRCFEVPVAHIPALMEAGSGTIALRASLADSAGKAVRESILPLELSRPICAQWLVVEINGSRRPVLAFLPGTFVADMKGPMSRSERFLEQTWAGLVSVAVDEEEADRANAFEVRVVAGSEASKARAERAPITASTQWAEFMKEAESLSESGRFHALGVMSLIEWSIASSPRGADLEPMVQGLLLALKQPPSRPRGSGSEPMSADLLKARALEQRILDWAAKQVRR